MIWNRNTGPQEPENDARAPSPTATTTLEPPEERPVRPQDGPTTPRHHQPEESTHRPGSGTPAGGATAAGVEDHDPADAGERAEDLRVGHGLEDRPDRPPGAGGGPGVVGPGENAPRTPRGEGSGDRTRRRTDDGLGRPAAPGTAENAGRDDAPAPLPGSPPAERAATPAGPDGRLALFSGEEEQRLRARWTAIQGSFIDEPREAVAEADALVQDTVRSLHEMFQRERRQFEALWTDEGSASTEDLRLAVQRYRALFERLLEK
jgi:hypothetical protein